MKLTTVFRDLLLFQGHVHDPRPFLDAVDPPPAQPARTTPPLAAPARLSRPLTPAGAHE